MINNEVHGNEFHHKLPQIVTILAVSDFSTAIRKNKSKQNKQETIKSIDLQVLLSSEDHGILKSTDKWFNSHEISSSSNKLSNGQVLRTNSSSAHLC